MHLSPTWRRQSQNKKVKWRSWFQQYCYLSCPWSCHSHSWTTAGNCLEIMQGKKRCFFSSFFFFFPSVCVCSVVSFASEKGEVWIETTTTSSSFSSIQCCCQGGRKTHCNPSCSNVQNTLQKLGASPMKHICRNSLWNWWCVSEAERLVGIATWNDGKHCISIEVTEIYWWLWGKFPLTTKGQTISSLLTASLLHLRVVFPF